MTPQQAAIRSINDRIKTLKVRRNADLAEIKRLEMRWRQIKRIGV